MKQQSPSEKDPWLALHGRIRGLLGVDLHSKPLPDIVDLASNQKKLVALASLLIRLEAADLQPDAAEPSVHLLQLIEKVRSDSRAVGLGSAS
jgi:hypothetical protein